MITRERYAQIITFLLLVILPLQSVWLRISELHGIGEKPFFFLSFWYEFLIFLLFVWAFFSLAVSKVKLRSLDWLTIFLLGWSCINFLWSKHSISDHIIGLRYSMVPVYAYLTARLSGVKREELLRWLRPVFWSVLIVCFIQLVLWRFGASLASLLGLGVTHRVVVIPQIYGSLPGPNQLATYLVLVAVISGWQKWSDRRWLVALSLIGVSLTFSRSAVLALGVVAVSWWTLWSKRTEKSRILLWLMVTIAVLAIGWLAVSLRYQGVFRDLITHGSSGSEHAKALEMSLQRIMHDGGVTQWFIGYGAGEAGPATLTRLSGFVPESWYLQIVYEYGLIGLGLYIAIFISALFISYKQRLPFVFFAIVSIMASSLFLHSLSDNPAASALVFILVATLIPHAMMEKP